MKKTPSEMVSELQSRLHISDATRLIFWLNEEQDYIEKLRPDWRFCISLDNTITTVASTAAYDLLNTENGDDYDFDHFLEVRDETNNKKLKPRSLTWLYRQDPTPTSEGKPGYYIRGGPNGTNNAELVRFWKVPNDVFTIKYDCYIKLPALSTSADDYSLIPDHSLLMIGTELRGRVDNEEPEDLQIIDRLKGQYRERLGSLIRHNKYNVDGQNTIRRDNRITMEGFGT